MKMKAIAKCTILFLSSLLVSGFIAEAATVTGTVTNKTTGKPSQGDTVVLVDVQAGMAEAARATSPRPRQAPPAMSQSMMSRSRWME
jgi:hypothetical protein